MPPLTEETKDRIALLYDSEGKNVTEIARTTEVSKPTVYKVLREYGLIPPAGEEEAGAETEEGAYEEEAEGADEAPDHGEEVGDEGEEEEYAPQPIVLGSRGSAFVGLAFGIGVGAAALYGAMMRGIIGPPPAGGSGTGR